MDSLRGKIDAVDTELVALLSKRLRLAHEILIKKLGQGLPVDDLERESQILERVKKLCSPEEVENIREIFSTIIRTGKKPFV